MTGGRSEKIERWRQIKEVLAAALEAGARFAASACLVRGAFGEGLTY